MSTVIAALFALCALVCAIAGAISDFRRLKIANNISLVIAACFVPALTLTTTQTGAMLSYVLPAVAILAISYLMFAARVLGGGDSKMMSALSLWIGIKGLPLFLIVMSFCGGLLAIAALLIRKYKPFPRITGENWIAQLQGGRSAVPYGIAIAIGGIWATIELGLCGEILSNLKSLFYVAA